MPATSLDLKGIAVQITDVNNVVVTETAQDLEGYWSRQIYVYGEPELSGGNPPIVAILHIRALQEEAIAVTAPEQKF
jgi:hypothetical protein